MSAFVSIVFPIDSTIWLERLAPTGSLEKSLLEDWTTPLPSYLSETEKNEFIDIFSTNGMDAPTCWYKSIVRGFMAEDDESRPFRFFKFCAKKKSS